jgi:hypothetical protein
MKRQMLAGAAALTLLFGGQALAQAVSLEFNPQQRTQIREYVVKEKVPRTVMKERIRVGGTVPSDIELHAVPSDWGPSVSSYRYYHSDGGVHFVDPSDRRVIYDLN